MKKVSLIVVGLLLMSSVVAFAGSHEIVSKEFDQTDGTASQSPLKYVEVAVFYRNGDVIPNYIVYNSGGYTGILHFQKSVLEDGDWPWGRTAYFAGWVTNANSPDNLIEH